MIMSAIDRYGGKLDEETVRQELEGNICRCTGYHNIVKSVLDVAGRMKVSQAAEQLLRATNTELIAAFRWEWRKCK